MKGRTTLRRLRRDRRGATIVEFALVAAPFIMLILGLVDVGYREYVSVMLQGAINEAARQVTVGGVTSDTVDTFVKARVAGVAPQATVAITKSSYFDFSNVGKPEPITTDTVPLGVYNVGDCYIDENGNGVWDSDSGLAGVGGSDDIVYYKVTVTFGSLVPVQNLFGWSGTETVSATTMMRNQPYASQPDPATKCT